MSDAQPSSMFGGVKLNTLILAVALASANSFSWHVPAATGTAVRRVSASGGYHSQQPARAAFVVNVADSSVCTPAIPASLAPKVRHFPTADSAFSKQRNRGWP